LLKPSVLIKKLVGPLNWPVPLQARRFRPVQMQAVKTRETLYIRSNMHQLSGFLKAVFSVYAFVLFLLCLLLVFPVVVVASLFGRVKGGNFIYLICRTWARVIYFCLGIRYQAVYEALPNPEQPCVFVFNHISYFDIPQILMSIRDRHFRILGKAEMARIPVFGFVYRQAVVSVQRDDAANRAQSIIQLKSVLKKGISIVIGPEGTFNLSHQPLRAFYDGAFKIAIETQTPIVPMLFLDTYDRMHHKSVFTVCPGRSRTVFLEPVGVEGLTLDDLSPLKKKVQQQMEHALRKYHATWIETNPEKSNGGKQG
jgi:1-acyl-sn-glycerol-3-phosphate acyltransferase